MGPRPGRRGNLPTPDGPHRHRLLQWGRVLEDAETASAGGYEPQRTKLQWGRVQEDAETVDTGVATLTIEQLQWGRVLEDAETHRPGGHG